MGVPKFFAWVVQNYPRIINHDANKCPEALLLDWNCGIHPCCYRVLDDINKKRLSLSREEIESRMIHEVIRFLDYLVNFCKPTKCVYIAIDGVAPRAKMNQQRMRRFKSQKEKKEMRELCMEFEQPIPIEWDSNAITPGLSF